MKEKYRSHRDEAPTQPIGRRHHFRRQGCRQGKGATSHRARCRLGSLRQKTGRFGRQNIVAYQSQLHAKQHQKDRDKKVLIPVHFHNYFFPLSAQARRATGTRSTAYASRIGLPGASTTWCAAQFRMQRSRHSCVLHEVSVQKPLRYKNEGRCRNGDAPHSVIYGPLWLREQTPRPSVPIRATLRRFLKRLPEQKQSHRPQHYHWQQGLEATIQAGHCQSHLIRP